MKLSIFIFCLLLAALSGSSVYAFEQAQPNKTVLKQTDHSALCSSQQGMTKKECQRTASTSAAQDTTAQRREPVNQRELYR